MNIRKRTRTALTSVVTTTTILWSMGIGALAPLAASAAVSLNAGDLIRGDATPAVYYYGGDGKRYVFPNEKIYATWYSGFGAVRRISDADLQAVPLASSNITYRPGVRLVKVTTDPKVYAVDKNGTLRWVKTEAVASALYGSDWNTKVEDLPDAFFANYTVGSEVAASSDYSVTTVQNASQTIAADKGLGGTTVTGALSMALASDTPAAASVPNGGADIVFAKLALSGSGTITGLKVKRTGLSSDTRITGVKLFDGTKQLGLSQTLNSQHKAIFTGLSVAISGAKTLTLAGDVVATGGAGEIIKFGVEAAGDVALSGGVSPSGTFPIEGNGMTITSVSIGSATLANGPQHPTSDTQVDADAVDFRFTQVRITAGSNEDVAVKQIVAIRSGTAADSDVKDIKLLNDKTGQVLGTAAVLESGSKATFDNLNVVVKKGEFVDLSVKASITGTGSSRNLGFELHDGNSYLIRVLGSQYGFGVTPTRTNFCATTGVTGGACQTQTIKLGTLDVARSGQSPSAGNIPLGGTLAPLAAFDFTVTGESVRVTQIKLSLTPVTASASEVTNIGLYDSAGGLIAGPKDGSTTTASTAETFTYTDTIVFPVGKTTLWVKANLATSMAAADTLTASLLAPSTNITIRGEQSGKSITARTTSAVTGNTQTVQGPALKLVTTGTPTAGNIVKGVQDFTFAVVDLDPSGSGEDVKVTELAITDTIGAGAAVADITNLELWGDPDNSDATDVVEKLMTSNSTAVGAATNTFTFSSPMKVAKNKASRAYLKADVLSSTTAGATNTHKYAASAATATGWTTGGTLTATTSGAGQVQTIANTGTLKVLVAASSPKAKQMVAGTTGNEIVKYKLTASNEAINLRQIPIAMAVGSAVPTTSDSTIGKVWVYSSDTESGTQTIIGNQNGYTMDASGKALVDIQASPLKVLKDKDVFITLKADFNPKEDVASGTNIMLAIGDDDSNASVYVAGTIGTALAGSYNIDAVGVDSGTTLTATSIDTVGDGSGNIQSSSNNPVYDGVLTVVRPTSQPDISPASNGELVYLDLVATGDTITVDDLEFVYSENCSGSSATAAATLKNRDDQNTTYATWASGTAWFDATTKDLHVKNSGVRNAGGFSSALQVGAGETRKLVLRGDISGCGAAGTNFQVRIDDGTATTSGVSWADVQLNNASSVVDTSLNKNLPLSGPSKVW